MKIYLTGLDNNKSQGLGDSIEKFTKATGIKKLADKIPGGCGCNKRKETLNKIFPYKKAKRIKQDWQMVEGEWKLIKTIEI